MVIFYGIINGSSMDRLWIGSWKKPFVISMGRYEYDGIFIRLNGSIDWWKTGVLLTLILGGWNWWNHGIMIGETWPVEIHWLFLMIFVVIDDDFNDYVWWFMMIYMIIFMIIWFKQIHIGLFWWWTKNSSHMIDAYICIYIHVLFAASEIMMVPTAFRMIPFWWVKSMQPPISTIKIAIVW